MLNSDELFMAACLRYARRHQGQTGTNPSVATIIVSENKIIARAITAKGGVPHSETQALAKVKKAELKNATAYISLEPCAHKGKTPPCTDALIASGIKKIITATEDYDERTAGKGHEKLSKAGIELTTNCLSEQAKKEMYIWLSYKKNKRPHVTLKLAISKDGFLGKQGKRTIITGELARNYANRLRAQYDAILVGHNTKKIDKPKLTCRISGLESRSPEIFILKSPTTINDILQKNITSLLVEGGAKAADSFLKLDLVDRIILFIGDTALGEGIKSPISLENIPKQFTLQSKANFANDKMYIFDSEQ